MMLASPSVLCAGRHVGSRLSFPLALRLFSSSSSSSPSIPPQPTDLQGLFSPPRSPYQTFEQQVDPNAEVLVARGRHSRMVSLNRPKQLNALNLSMVNTLTPLFKSLELNDQLNSVVLTGVGEKAFCAGGDVKSLVMAAKQGDVSVAREFFRREYQLNHFLGTTGLPVIAHMKGITMGGGVGLSAHCTFRLATPSTVFAMPECAIGFFPDVGASWFLSRLPGSVGVYLALTGARLKWADLARLGVATHLFTGDINTLFQALSEEGAVGIRQTERVLSSLCVGRDYLEQLPTDLQHRGSIARIFSKDTVEEIMAELEQHGSEWAQQSLQAMRRASPISLKVTLEQLKVARTRSFDEIFDMEYRIACRFLEIREFAEGVDALLIRKDNKPNWTYKTVEEVSDSFVQSFFESDHKLDLDPMRCINPSPLNADN